MDFSPNVINLCAHPIKIYSESGSVLLKEYNPSGSIFQLVSKEQTKYRDLDGIECVENQNFDDISISNYPNFIKELSKEGDNVILIVSMPVGEYIKRKKPSIIKDNFSIVGPDSSQKFGVRDENGTILGTKRLLVYVPGEYFRKD